MFHDFLTPQAIKQAAKCPLGSGPGLVRGRFLSHCGRERRMELPGSSGPRLPAGLGSRTGWDHTLEMRPGPGFTQTSG